jgi:putative hemolysin
MVLMNSIFAAYEIGLACVSLARLHVLARENRPGARVAVRMKQRMESSLAVIQLGMALVAAVAAATGGAGAQEVLAPLLQSAGLPHRLAEILAVGMVVVPLTALTIIFGELVPKIFALRNQEWACLRLSPLIHCFAVVFTPAAWLLEASATGVLKWGERLWKPRTAAPPQSEAAELQELRAIANLARTARLIGAKEESIILGAARLSGRPLREILLPAEHISLLNANDSVSDCLIAAHLDMHTRFPVTERAGDPQGIVGYVNFKDIVAHMRLSPQEPTLRGILRPMPSFSEDLPISSALESLMRERTHIALVRGAATGQVLGLVTLEDIIEELVGDIQDEYDLLPAHVSASGSSWVAGGGVSLARLRAVTGIDLAADLPATEVHNLSGWVIGHLGHAVRGGEVVERPGVQLVVRKVRRQRVLEAQLAHRRSARPNGGGELTVAGKVLPGRAPS